MDRKFRFSSTLKNSKNNIHLAPGPPTLLNYLKSSAVETPTLPRVIRRDAAFGGINEELNA